MDKIVNQFLNGENEHNKVSDAEAKRYAQMLSEEFYWYIDEIADANQIGSLCYVCNKTLTQNPSGVCNNCVKSNGG